MDNVVTYLTYRNEVKAALVNNLTKLREPRVIAEHTVLVPVNLYSLLQMAVSTNPGRYPWQTDLYHVVSEVLHAELRSYAYVPLEEPIPDVVDRILSSIVHLYYALVKTTVTHMNTASYEPPALELEQELNTTMFVPPSLRNAY